MKAGFSSRLILLAGLCVGLAGPVSAIDLGKLIDLGGKLVEINSDVSEEEEVRIGGNLVSGLDPGVRRLSGPRSTATRWRFTCAMPACRRRTAYMKACGRCRRAAA